MAVLLYLAAAVLVYAALQLVGALLFAFGFRKVVLRVVKPKPEYGVLVRKLTNNSVVLEAQTQRQDIGHPGVIGIFWKGGHARLGEVVSVDEQRITRRLNTSSSDPPVCESGWDHEREVGIDGYVYSTGPAEVGLAYTVETYRSPLGDFKAWVVPAKGSATWAIHVHGWRAEMREAVRLLPALNRTNTASMVIEYRNDPAAPLDPTGRYRFGLTEWEEVEAAVGYATDRGAERVVLVGYSTGCAHIFSFLERSKRAERVSGLILDSPNLVLVDTVRANIADARIPGLELAVPQLTKELSLVLVDLFWKIDWDQTNYADRASHFLDIPTLVFHGTADHRVPIAQSRRLKAEVPDSVHLVEAVAAGHVMSWNADPSTYERHLERFINRVRG